MKPLPLCILIAIITIAAGCGQHNAFFQSVEDLMDSAPDSALVLAEAFDPSGRAEKARRALLIAKAKNKAYCDIADDSLIETAVDYYRGHNDSLEVQALYYSALRLHSQRNYNQSLYRLMIAEEKAEQTNNLFYLAMTQRLASACYNELYVMDRAEEYIIKARHNFSLAGKEIHAIWCELLVADALAINSKPDSAISILNNNRLVSDFNFEVEWHETMGYAQFFSGNDEETIKNYEWLESNSIPLNCGQHCRLSECYININNIEKAEEHLNAALKICHTWNDNVYTGVIRSKILEANGDINKAYKTYKESTNILHANYDRLLTHPYYDLIDKNLRAEKKRYAEQNKLEKTKRILISIIFALILLIAITAITIVIKKNINNNYRIRHLMSRARELNMELKRFSDKEKEANCEAENILSRHIGFLNIICNEWYLLPENKKNGKVFGTKIDMMLSEINSDETMSQFENLINKYNSNLIKNICLACSNMTKENKRIIIYLSLGLSFDSICFLTSKSKKTFAVYRHRLKKMIEESNLKDKESTIKTLFGRKSDYDSLNS